MALPDTTKIVRGTSKVFSSSGVYSPTAGQPSGTDADIELSTLAISGVARQSVKLDLGSANLDIEYAMDAYIEFFTAPTAGGTVDFYLGFSSSGTAGTNNPAGLSGADAVFQGYGADTASGTEALPQLLYVGSLVVANDAVLQVQRLGTFVPKDRYCSLVVVNNTSVALANTDSIEIAVVITPLQFQVQD